jgi:hypothetical protein
VLCGWEKELVLVTTAVLDTSHLTIAQLECSAVFIYPCRNLLSVRTWRRAGWKPYITLLHLVAKTETIRLTLHCTALHCTALHFFLFFLLLSAK